jgi:3-hydroxyisobutyrate dehydrogenase-like beta-hydroxyacid dehydrogenase
VKLPAPALDRRLPALYPVAWKGPIRERGHDVPTVGLLHPGEMGTAVGASVVATGARVLWAGEARSTATRARAEEIGLEDAGTLAALVEQSGVILAVVPPHAALDTARAVAARGFRGLYVDANAVAPATAREIGRVVEASGARFVDGGIIGPATRRPGAARIYLSGAAAPDVSGLFAAGPVEAIVLDGPAGAASALKAAFAGWNKGSQALLAAIRAFAIAEGVDGPLLAEWKISMPEVPARSERAVADNARKAWRFVGEMDEIARSLADVGLPEGFHRAAGEIYRRLAGHPASGRPTVEDAAATLLRRS